MQCHCKYVNHRVGRLYQPVNCWSKVYKTGRRRLVKEFYGWDSTRIECGGPATICEPNPQTLLRAIRKQTLLSEV